MWNPNTQMFWIATNIHGMNKAPSTTEFTDVSNVRLNIQELGELVQEGHPHCDPIGLNQEGRPGWTPELAEASGPFIQRQYNGSPRCKNNSYLTNLVVMESDGDGYLSTATESNRLQEFCSMLYTSCSHGKKESAQGITDRFRMAFVLGRKLETFHDSDEYTDPHWQLAAVWDWVHDNVACPALEVEALSDKSGREAARQFFGCNSEHQIGLGPLAEEYPEPCQVFFPGGGLDAVLVNQILDEAEPRYLKSSSSQGTDFVYGDYEDTDELSIRDASIIRWILENRILSDHLATERNSWFTVARILKKYDPSGEVFFESFVKFSHQCTDVGKTDDAETLEAFWHQLPDATDTLASFNTIKSYASQSNPDWKTNCPFYGGSTTMTKATKPFISGTISVRGQEALAAIDSEGGLDRLEQELRSSYEARRSQVMDRLAVPATSTSDF